ncbi:hypothetical protein GO285_01375 [Ralstonia solanacearum]|jgi:hypothetical protein|nr:hypothetical protein [Ralstonia sp. 3PA37C10]NKA72510.1 hypothetical protein [Ralstonia solanacearum]NKG09574.1 hypothetical protein [Ralstonia solanacearum]
MKAQQQSGSPQTLGRRVSFWLIAVAVALYLSYIAGTSPPF